MYPSFSHKFKAVSLQFDFTAEEDVMFVADLGSALTFAAETITCHHR